MSNAQLVTDDFAKPENKAKLELCVEKAMEAIEADVTLRVPRTEAECANAFAAWLTVYHAKLGPILQAEFQREFPVPAARLKPSVICEIVETHVWPQVEAFLRSIALRGRAYAWVSRNMGDATFVGEPEPEGDYWRLPLGVAKYGENLGQIVLDADGNVIPHLTSTRQQMLETIRDRSPVTTATSGQ